jgi:hypothetical protein
VTHFRSEHIPAQTNFLRSNPFSDSLLGETDGIGGGEELFGHEQLWRLTVVAAVLVHTQCNHLILPDIRFITVSGWKWRNDSMPRLEPLGKAR